MEGIQYGYIVGVHDEVGGEQLTGTFLFTVVEQNSHIKGRLIMEVINIDAKLFKAIRKVSGHTQEDYAALLGISRSLVAKIEVSDRAVTDDIAQKVRQIHGLEHIIDVRRLLRNGKEKTES